MSYIWGLFFIHFHYRRDAKHIFECFLEVGQPEDYSQNPYIIQSYPLNYKDREADKLQSVPAFTFPCQIEMWVIFFWHIFVFTNVLHKTAGNKICHFDFQNCCSKFLFCVYRWRWILHFWILQNGSQMSNSFSKSFPYRVKGYIASWKIVIFQVFLSKLPWHKMFYKMLNHAAELITYHSQDSLFRFLHVSWLLTALRSHMVGYFCIFFYHSLFSG